MKRITTIFLKFLYPIPAIGVTTFAYFYDGKVTSVFFNPFNTKHKSPCVSKKIKKNYHKDKTTTVKLDAKQQKTQLVSYKVGKSTNFQMVISTNLTLNYKTPFLLTEFDQSTHPPDNLKHPLYTHFCI
jgi:hypothetical protein